ncbi:MAG: MlaD family protein [Bacteroidales bacterium]
MRKEIRIGILVIAACIIFYWGYNYLSNNKIFSQENVYYAVYPEIRNLSKSNPVRINGVKVGVVKNIQFPIAPRDHRVLVSLSLNKDIPVPEGTVAKIEGDLLGSNMVNLKFSKKDNYLETGDTLQTEIATSIQEEVSLQMMPVKHKAENLMLQLDSVLAVVQYIFNKETRTDIAQSFSNIKHTIDNLERTTSKVDVMVDEEKNRLNIILQNIESISNNLKNNNQAITHTLDNFARVSDTLSHADIGKTMAELNATIQDLKQVSNRIQRGDGTLGKLLEDDTLYYELEQSAANLDMLVEDIRLNPQRYLHFSVFGKDPNKTRHPDSRK